MHDAASGTLTLALAVTSIDSSLQLMIDRAEIGRICLGAVELLMLASEQPQSR